MVANTIDTSIQICRSCGEKGTGNYCSLCGQIYKPKHITLQNLIHEVFHYFTHADKGILFTIKELIRHPGTMQRHYIEGDRARHQKPFSMFFLCGTICGLAYYFINLAYRNIYGTTDFREEFFFRHYFILIQALLAPIYALITWVVFRNNKYNYAEVLVSMLYTLGFVFLIIIPINALKLIFPNLETKYIELAFLLPYTIITNLNFFKYSSLWVDILKSLVTISIVYVLSNAVQQLIIHLIK